MSGTVKLAFFAVLVSVSSLAVGQSTLGALLDAGARKLTAEEFKAELVQRVLVGPTGVGVSVEIMYMSTGGIAGANAETTPGPGRELRGEWRIDSEGRICASMRLLGRQGEAVLAPRCQFWFKLGDTYYLSDSDSDRYAKVLPRKLK
jgi:hypothetical protein